MFILIYLLTYLNLSWFFLCCHCKDRPNILKYFYCQSKISAPQFMVSPNIMLQISKFFQYFKILVKIVRALVLVRTLAGKNRLAAWNTLIVRIVSQMFYLMQKQLAHLYFNFIWTKLFTFFLIKIENYSQLTTMKIDIFGAMLELICLSCATCVCNILNNNLIIICIWRPPSLSELTPY